MREQTFPLPTLDRLGVQLDAPNVDASQIVKEWFSYFDSNAQAGDVEGIVNLFVDESFWRDMLSLTWDFRTFIGISSIKQFLSSQLKSANLNSLKLRPDTISLQQPFPDLAWIQFMFDFKTSKIGIGSGIGRLIPQSDGSWKCHTLFTNLEDLQGFPELLGPLRDPAPNHGLWEAQRAREVAFEDSEPVALIIGGGQSGLDVAARLKTLGVSHLVIEKNKRIGDSWRNRYEALCLHDPVWYDHMPYIPFPSTWPVYSPSVKLAGWLESYAQAMEINVWTSAIVTKASFSSSTNTWQVTVQHSDGKTRVFERIRHVIFAAGLAAGEPNMPSYPGMDIFKGQILHSCQHKKASDHKGKKVVVVGACTSAHDIASDYYLNGVDVTMYQRSSTYIMSTKNGWDVLFGGLYSENAPPTDIADRLSASFPHLFMYSGMAKRSADIIAEKDKPLLDGLAKRGFRTNMGLKGTGFGLLAWNRAGGYYLDVGASQMIIDGKIKLKNDSELEGFTESGLKFKDGTELAADVVLFATGYAGARTYVRKICGDEVGDKCRRLWGLNDEGEIYGVWRDLGVPGLWYMMGNLALGRFHSKHIALQIKAIEEGVFGTRYSAEDN